MKNVCVCIRMTLYYIYQDKNNLQLHRRSDLIQPFHTCSCHKFRFASRYHQTHDLDGEITIIDVNTTLHVRTPSYLFSIRSNSIRHQLWRDPTSLTFHFHALKRELNKHF